MDTPDPPATDQQPASVTRDDILAAVAAGAHTEQELATQFNIAVHPVFGAPALSQALRELVCADLLYMQVVDAAWHYKSTVKGRAEARRYADTGHVTDPRSVR